MRVKTPDQVGTNTVANAMLSETVALLIDRLSSMTPMERRKVLDSVAGVTSYDDEIN